MSEARNELTFRRIDACHERICTGQRELFRLILELDELGAWRDDGARDMAQWLWMRYGISEWKARRWIACAHALEQLPRISAAFASGELGIDKVVELTRLATPETEVGLLPWARHVSAGRIRHKADLAVRRSRTEAEEVERVRTLSWWYFDEGRRFGLEAELPAADGAVVARALERMAERIPVMPGEDETLDLPARRADALVAVASARLGADPDADRATVVVHASVGSLTSQESGCEIEGGPVIHPQTARRLACSGRIQAMVEDDAGNVVRLGRMRRDPPAWMLRQLHHRDGGCTFPGCGSRMFLHAHHIVWWDRGRVTDLANLTLVCSFHHKLVHEYGWSIRRGRTGVLAWFRPRGIRYRAGPAPPPEPIRSERWIGCRNLQLSDRSDLSWAARAVGGSG
jgi:Domain of unknown function (DUF222)/HNH endonuclease